MCVKEAVNEPDPVYPLTSLIPEDFNAFFINPKKEKSGGLPSGVGCNIRAEYREEWERFDREARI